MQQLDRTTAHLKPADIAPASDPIIQPIQSGRRFLDLKPSSAKPNDINTFRNRFETMTEGIQKQMPFEIKHGDTKNSG